MQNIGCAIAVNAVSQTFKGFRQAHFFVFASKLKDGAYQRALSGWRPRPDRGSLGGMTTSPDPYCGFRFPPEVIQHAVWLYHCFSLSLRRVETILAARGVVVAPSTWLLTGLRGGAEPGRRTR